MTEKITRFPEGLDTPDELPNISATDREDDAGLEHDVVHTAANQAILAIQKKLGKDADPNPASIDFRVKKLEEGGGGGSGLAVGDRESVLLPGDDGITIPARPSAWLQVEINGVRYVVPGFEVKTVELVPVTDYQTRRSELFSLTNYIGEHVVLEG